MLSRSSTVLGIAATAMLVGGCGRAGLSDDVPTADRLAADLITPADLPGDWDVWVPPDAPDLAATGLVSDAMQELLPRLEFCDAAGGDARQAAEDLRWMAFRQMDLSVDDPITPPSDQVGRRVLVQEFLTSAAPEQIESTFDLLRDGTTSCVGAIPAGEEGPGGAVFVEVPEIGDDRFGTLTTVAEAGGGAEWRIHNVLVNDGAVLMAVSVVDIRAGELTEPLLTSEDVGEVVRAAYERLR